jgi:aminoglycoside phosphotransferase (APT) family kinase protein
MSAPLLDRPAPVREGEELDTEALSRFLREALPGLAGPLTVEQYPAGYSNLTYLVRVGDREIVLRRPPVGSQVKTAHDMGREFRVLRGLHPHWPRVPAPLASCDDGTLLGAPFYLMERVPGVILRGGEAPPGLLDAERSRRLSEVFVDTLAELHGLDLPATGLAALGRPEGYVERQVRGWVDRYQRARTHDLPELESAARWLVDGIPAPAGVALVHNDYKFDNLVLDPADPTRIRAVLDWEMATVGDPLLDLGTSLGYWVEVTDPEPLQRFCFGPTQLPGMMRREELLARYAERTGRWPEQPVYYYVFGLLKIAVIAQQIYFRYAQGLTRDERFALLPGAIQALGRAAVKAAETGRL